MRKRTASSTMGLLPRHLSEKKELRKRHFVERHTLKGKFRGRAVADDEAIEYRHDIQFAKQSSPVMGAVNRERLKADHRKSERREKKAAAEKLAEEYSRERKALRARQKEERRELRSHHDGEKVERSMRA